jgi:hypothetical protein
MWMACCPVPEPTSSTSTGWWEGRSGNQRTRHSRIGCLFRSAAAENGNGSSGIVPSWRHPTANRVMRLVLLLLAPLSLALVLGACGPVY